MSTTVSDQPILTPEEQRAFLPHILAFLHEKGIRTEATRIDGQTFLPGIRIRKGVLQYDEEKLLYPGDLLHEAGHIAVTAAEERDELGDNVDPEKKSGEELCAILWSYAAAVDADLPVTLVFHPDGYKGGSTWLIDTLRDGKYIGMPFFEWMGMAVSPEKAAEKGVAPFPHMLRWLRA